MVRVHHQFAGEHFREILKTCIKLIVDKKGFIVADKIVLQAIVKGGRDK